MTSQRVKPTITVYIPRQSMTPEHMPTLTPGQPPSLIGKYVSQTDGLVSRNLGGSTPQFGVCIFYVSVFWGETKQTPQNNSK